MALCCLFAFFWNIFYKIIDQQYRVVVVVFVFLVILFYLFLFYHDSTTMCFMQCLRISVSRFVFSFFLLTIIMYSIYIHVIKIAERKRFSNRSTIIISLVSPFHRCYFSNKYAIISTRSLRTAYKNKTKTIDTIEKIFIITIIFFIVIIIISIIIILLSCWLY